MATRWRPLLESRLPRGTARDGDGAVKLLLPASQLHFELWSSGWARVAMGDAIRGPPDRYLADERGAEATVGWRPAGIRVEQRLRLEETCKISDKQGSLTEIASPDWVILQPCRNAGDPGQRPIVLVSEGWESPVEDGGYVARG